MERTKQGSSLTGLVVLFVVYVVALSIGTLYQEMRLLGGAVRNKFTRGREIVANSSDISPQQSD